MLVGSQGHALSVLDAIEKAGRYCVVGLLDRFREKGTIAWGYEILGAEEDLAAVASVRNVTGAVVAVGNNLARASVCAVCSSRSRSCNFQSSFTRQQRLAQACRLTAGLL